MNKFSTRAWAEMYNASITQRYLVEIIQPHLDLLCGLWINLLKDCSQIRLDSDAVVVHPMEPASTGLSLMFASTTKGVLMSVRKNIF